MEAKVDENTVRGYLKNRKDYLKRQVVEFSYTLKQEVKYMNMRLEDIPVEMYPEVQKVIGEYRKVIEFLEGF